MKAKKRYQDMTGEELAAATREFDKPWTGRGLPGRAMTAKERTRFEAWQKKSLAEETAPAQATNLTLGFPKRLTARIGELAKAKHTTPENLVKRIVQDAVCAVA